MATILAAAIQDVFGTKPILVDGLDGIYEVSLNGNVIYTNQSQCSSGFPANEEIFLEVSKYKDPLPGKEDYSNSNTSKNLNVIQNPDIIPTDCGCSSINVETVSTKDISCCPSPIDESKNNVDSADKSCCGKVKK